MLDVNLSSEIRANAAWALGVAAAQVEPVPVANTNSLLSVPSVIFDYLETNKAWPAIDDFLKTGTEKLRSHTAFFLSCLCLASFSP